MRTGVEGQPSCHSRRASGFAGGKNTVPTHSGGAVLLDEGPGGCD